METRHAREEFRAALSPCLAKDNELKAARRIQTPAIAVGACMQRPSSGLLVLLGRCWSGANPRPSAG